MSYRKLSKQELKRILPYLGIDHYRGNRADDGKLINGIRYKLATGCRWEDMPPEYGNYRTAALRYREWKDKGIWDRMEHLLDFEPTTGYTIHANLKQYWEVTVGGRPKGWVDGRYFGVLRKNGFILREDRGYFYRRCQNEEEARQAIQKIKEQGIPFVQEGSDRWRYRFTRKKHRR